MGSARKRRQTHRNFHRKKCPRTFLHLKKRFGTKRHQLIHTCLKQMSGYTWLSVPRVNSKPNASSAVPARNPVPSGIRAFQYFGFVQSSTCSLGSGTRAHAELGNSAEPALTAPTGRWRELLEVCMQFPDGSGVGERWRAHVGKSKFQVARCARHSPDLWARGCQARTRKRRSDEGRHSVVKHSRSPRDGQNGQAQWRDDCSVRQTMSVPRRSSDTHLGGNLVEFGPDGGRRPDPLVLNTYRTDPPMHSPEE